MIPNILKCTFGHPRFASFHLDGSSNGDSRRRPKPRWLPKAILGNWPGNGKRVGFELHQHPGVLRRPAQESDQAFAWGLRSGGTQIIQSNQSPQQTDIPSVVLTGIVLIWRGFKARQAAVKSIAASCRSPSIRKLTVGKRLARSEKYNIHYPIPRN